MRYSRQKLTICTSLPELGWQAGVGRSVGPRSARDGEVGPDRGLGRQSGRHPGQRDDPCQPRAEGTRARSWWWWIPIAAATAAVADLHIAPRPGTDGALACAVMHVAFRDGFADRAYMARMPTARTRWRRIWRRAGRNGRRRSPVCPCSRSRISRGCIAAPQRSYIRLGYGFARSRNGVANMHAVSCLPTVTGKWQHEGGGALWSNRGMYHWDKTLIEGLDALDPSIRMHGHEPYRQRADRRSHGAARRAAGARAADPEPEPADGLPRQQPRAPRLRARRSVRVRARAVHDRDGALGRYRAAGDDVHGARRSVSGRRPYAYPDRPEADRAAGRMPLQP